MRRYLPIILGLTLAVAGGCGHPAPIKKPSQPKPIAKPQPAPLTYRLPLGQPSDAFGPILADLLKTVQLPVYLPAQVPTIPKRDTYYINYLATPSSYSVTLYDNTGKPLAPNQAPTDDPTLKLIGNISGDSSRDASLSPLPDLPVLQQIPLSLGPGIVGHMVYVGLGGPTQYGYLTWPEGDWLFAVGASGPGWWISPQHLISEGHILAAQYRGKPPLASVDKGSAFFSYAEHQPSTLNWRWGSDVYQAWVNSWTVSQWVSTLVGVKP